MYEIIILELTRSVVFLDSATKVPQETAEGNTDIPSGKPPCR